MICDKCREEIVGAIVSRKDGEKWCIECARAAKRKPSNVVPSKDPFVRLSRALARIYDGEGHRYGTVIAKSRAGRRAYTNGHLLLSESASVAKNCRLIDVDGLWEKKGMSYPGLNRIIERESAPTASMATIPEDFYQYARAFAEPKPRRREVVVKIRENEIVIVDSRDGSEMHYREFSTIPVREANFDYLYFMCLKPKEIASDAERPAWIQSSYEPVVDACKAVLLMPVGKD